MELLRSFSAICAILVMLPSLAPAADDQEKKNAKIEALIAHVEGLDGAKFIHNDSEYDAKTAGKFLRAKWDRDKKEIKTAADFIAKVATKSSTSGKPYKIKFKDGKEVESGPYLTEQAKKDGGG